MRLEHKFKLKITIEGDQGHGKTLVTQALQELLNTMGACVIVRDHRDFNDGEYRHTMPTEDAR